MKDMYIVTSNGTDLVIRVFKWAVVFQGESANKLCFYDIDMLEDFTTLLANEYDELEYLLEDLDSAHLMHLDGMRVEDWAQANAPVMQSEVSV